MAGRELLQHLPFFQRVYFKVARVMMGIGTTAVISYHSLPHLFPHKMSAVKGFVDYMDCKDIPPEFKEVLSSTCNKLNIDPSKVSLFYSSGFHTVSAGSLFLPGGAVIGLPRNYYFQSTNDIRKAPIMHKGKPIDWDSRIGTALQSVLLPNTEHLKFVIGHELIHIKNADFLPQTAFAVSFLYGFYRLGLYIPTILPKRHFGRVAMIHSGIWLGGFLLYRRINRKFLHSIEHKADQGSAEIGADYCSGGIDYMRSRMKLNRILRKMDPDNGAKQYTKVGNEVRNATHPKRTDRLKRLKNIQQLSYKENGSLHTEADLDV